MYWTVVRMMYNTTYMWQIAWFPYVILQPVYNSCSSEELCKTNTAHLSYVCYICTPSTVIPRGHAVAHLVEALHYKLEVVGSILNDITDILPATVWLSVRLCL
jgi:hypothetical protein